MGDKELMQGAYMKAPSRSYTSWENTMCNPLGDMRTQTQSAWHDGYASAKVEKEWYGLTAKDLAEIPPSCFEGAIWADAKLKEKNT
jgi:hypothetical protein